MDQSSHNLIELLEQAKFSCDPFVGCDEQKFAQAYLQTLEAYKDHVALGQLVQDQWVETNYHELCENTKKTATLFVENLNLVSGEKFAILSESSAEYIELILAAIYVGVVVIPLDVRSSASELQYVLNHSEPKFIFSSSKYIETLFEMQSRLTSQPKIISIEPKLDKKSELHLKIQNLKECPSPLSRQSLQPLFISYTSGTMGSPKGAQIQLKNILFEMQSLCKGFGTEKIKYLSLLPINHLLELTGGILSPLATGSSIVLANTTNPMVLLSLFQKHKVSRILAVPLVLEMFRFGIERKLQEGLPLKASIFHFLLRLAKYIPFRKLRRILFFSVHKQFGGEFHDFVVGGSKLTNELYDYFTLMGFRVFQGYGLTETAPVISVNTPKNNCRGSVGPPFESIEIKIDGPREGVIYVRGPNVSFGYYKNKEETEKAFSNGWFNTGDIGYLNGNGFLFITGRDKNLIVLKSGKKVQPEEVESVLSQCPYVKEVIVLADRSEDDEKVVALAVIANRNYSEQDIMQELKKYRNKLSDYKWPSHFKFQYDDLPRTSTQKIKRLEAEKLYNST